MEIGTNQTHRSDSNYTNKQFRQELFRTKLQNNLYIQIIHTIIQFKHTNDTIYKFFVTVIFNTVYMNDKTILKIDKTILIT